MKKPLIVIPLVALSFGVMAEPPLLQLNLSGGNVSFELGLGWLRGSRKNIFMETLTQQSIKAANLIGRLAML
ncbi:hypothetical protein [Xenorhabdus japonica]|uniref:Uncharacterized protein n=1 Tax=Xenorhabdus japonica TaxID=53341 RepID=A0A1I5DP54_9GAMM|nr:hypothetical protein [Xenorhabdus japonica]SFO00937.1 hypothetical protein SAMN05421579_1442 [Xenorhabdus japonica]